MCGRFTVANLAGLNERFQLEEHDLQAQPRYNVAPSQDVLVVYNNDGLRQLGVFKWGLIPFWAKDTSVGNKMINARAETVDIKPSFKHALKKKRCLIIADGFYEWKRKGAKKEPYRITLKSGELFAFAGLWDSWVSPTGQVINSCAIITTAPNELMEPIHNRMPAILQKEHEALWLDKGLTDCQLLKSILVPYPAEYMRAYKVSTLVNSPQVDIARCIEPIIKE